MYKDVARAIEGIDIYPIIGIVIFFGVFVIMFVTTYSAKKKSVQAWGQLPLEDGTLETATLTTSPLTHTNHEQA